MALTSEPSLIRSKRTTPTRLGLAVADAGWFTTENLFRELGRDDVSTLLLRCMDVRNGLRKGLPPWPFGRGVSESGPRCWEQDLVLPSGWMKRFPRLGMRPIARAVRGWRGRHAPGPLALVMTYPHYLYLRDMLRPAHSVYFNLDDYTLFWPGRADETRELERRAVAESDVTVCVSRLRTDQLREQFPGAAYRIYHLPHGTPSWALSDRPWDRPAPAPDDLAHLPRPLIGYVGSLEDRVDWQLLSRVSDAFPKGSVVIVGRTAPATDAPWFRDCQRFLSRPNVHAIGWRSQGEISRYSRTFDVALIPYLTDHPFNRQCCPTKIMDYMGSTRPVVSTDLPECRLHADLFDVTTDAESFLAAIRAIVESGSDDGRAAARLARARTNTCETVASRLLDMLNI